MQLTGHATLDVYLNYMHHNPTEASAMFSDILIGVTNFFRDPQAWEALANKALPALFQEKRDGELIRFWAIGCSTGEEAYSLGILLLEQAARMEKRYELQVFASGLDDPSLAQAREGIYPAAIEADVSPQRLERFFTPHGNHYQVRRELRDIMLFTNHSVLRAPPFSRLNLISCRNLLIYLNRDMHADVLDVFHYALNPGGYLFLGGSETADSVKELFSTVDKSHRIYKAKPWSGEQPHIPALPLKAPRSHYGETFLPRGAQRNFVAGMPPLEEQHLKALETFGPPSIWVDEDYLVLNLSESVGRYLLQPGGPITSDLLRLVRPELQIELRSTLFRAFEKDMTVVSSPVLVRFNGQPHRVIVSVRPDSARAAKSNEHTRKALVVFLEDESEPALEKTQAPPQETQAGRGNETVQQLEEEVQHLRGRLQATLEESNSSNEEMKAANEELQSINEEYRSTTEELETSKEELQSVNEELQTVNNELRNKFEEVSRVNNDLENLMDATKIATLFLDRELKIKRYTPGMEALFNIRPSDRGRPIADFTHKLGYQDLVEDARSVLQRLSLVERESTSPNGGWLLIRLRPYRTAEDRIDGVVVSFVDITEVKRAERIQQNYESFYTLFHANPIPTLLTRLQDDVVMNANQAFLDYMDLAREKVIGQTAQEFNLGLDLSSKNRAGLTTQLLKGGGIRNFEEEIDLPSGETKTVLTSLQYIYIEETDAMIASFIDITDRVQAERRVRQLTLDLTKAEQEERDRIAQMLHDDLQQRLFAIKMQLDNMQETVANANLPCENFDFAKLEEWLIETISITRQLSSDLSPLGLKGEDLPETLLWLASQMKDQYGLEVELEANNVRVHLNPNLQTLLFRSVRELLFNVVKHAGTLQAQLLLHQVDGDHIQIQIIDGGKGFAPAAVLEEENVAHGLMNARQRLMLYGCSMDVDSGEGRGTCVTIDCPTRGGGPWT